MMPYTNQDAAALRRRGYKPYALGHLANGDKVELISFPFASDGGSDLLINVREPNDPVTMRTVSCGQVYIDTTDPEPMYSR